MRRFLVLVTASLGLLAACGDGATEITSESSTEATSVSSNSTPIDAPEPTPTAEVSPTTSPTTLPPTTSTGDPAVLVSEAAAAYTEAIQAGDLDAVRAVSSTRCGEVLTKEILGILTAAFSGGSVATSVLSLEDDEAVVQFEIEDSPFKPGKSTFRRLDGRWLWDGCD